MAEVLPSARPSPTRVHTGLAWGLIAWLVVMMGLLAWALMLRVLQCGSHRELGWLLDHVCSFRGLGSFVLACDAVLMAALIWHTAQYDPFSLMPLQEPARGWRKPPALFMASVRALRVEHTPHRLKHRVSFWALLALVLAFSYVVLFSRFLFW